MLIAISAILLVVLAAAYRHYFLSRRHDAEPKRAIRVGRYSELETAVLGPPPKLMGADGNRETKAPVPLGLPSEQSADGETRHAQALTVGAAMDGVMPAAGFVWSWTQVDDHLFKAIEHMTHESIRSVGDLSRVLDSHEWAHSSWSGPDAGLVAAVKGHLGEWLAADHLTQAGHTVVMPDAPNQAGWDLLVNGDATNVKTVQDAAQAIHEHFSAHPDVSVLLPHDAANIPAEALHFDGLHAIDFSAIPDGPHVLVDDALSHADAAHAAHSGLDVASGHVGIHLPWITVAISVFREGLLLSRGDTDCLRATKNVTVDGASVAGGIFLGAKTGGVVGTWFGPVGTVVGALVGGVIGGISGRVVANVIKHQPLEDARERLIAVLESYRMEETRTANAAQDEWSAFHKDQQDWLASTAAVASAQAQGELAKTRAGLRDLQAVSGDEALALLRKTADRLSEELAQVKQEFVSFALWRRLLWPSEDLIGARARYQAAKEFLVEWTRERRRVEGFIESGLSWSTESVYDLALSCAQMEETVRSHLLMLGVARAAAVKRAEEIRGGAVASVIKSREDVTKRIRQRQRDLLAKVKSQLETTLNDLAVARDRFHAELRKAGKVNDPRASEGGTA